MNTDWAIEQLSIFIERATLRSIDMGPGIIGSFYETTAPDDEVAKQANLVEQILDRVITGWKSRVNEIDSDDSRWAPLRELAVQARELLERESEIRQNLGENAPEISAARLHTWVWSGASSLWQSGHFREAVEGAIRKLNAETQNKVGRRDVSETDLFKQAFTLDAAALGKARLRRMTPDVSDTYKSVQRGAMAFAEGVFAGIRNPLSHEANHELTEQEALEYLAALSVLARWVDASEVEAAS